MDGDRTCVDIYDVTPAAVDLDLPANIHHNTLRSCLYFERSFLEPAFAIALCHQDVCDANDQRVRRPQTNPFCCIDPKSGCLQIYITAQGATVSTNVRKQIHGYPQLRRMLLPYIAHVLQHQTHRHHLPSLLPTQKTHSTAAQYQEVPSACQRLYSHFTRKCDPNRIHSQLQNHDSGFHHHHPLLNSVHVNLHHDLVAHRKKRYDGKSLW